MFRLTEDRLDYGKALAPPPGFRCEFAVGTTYSLDLETLLGVPIALFLSEQMDSTLLENPLLILEGVRKSAENFALFCEGGQIKVPSKGNPVFALLESSVFQVALKNGKSFHPKVWIIKYINEKGLPLYRFVILSRNLTFDRSWDVAVVLEGEPAATSTDKTKPLIDFLQYLRQLITDVKKKRRIAALINELPYVSFQTGDRHFVDFDFFPLGIGNGYDKESAGLFTTYHDLLVISPFLSQSTVLELDRLSLSNSQKTLITRRTEISKLTNDLLQSFPCYCLKEMVIDGEEALSEPDTIADLQKQDIHAKLYFRSKNTEHLLYVGSANCSSSAWNGNVEFMLRLKYEKWGFRISQIIDELFNRNGLEDDRHNPFERIEAVPLIEVTEDDVQQKLEKAIKRLCQSHSKASVTAGTGEYKVTIEFDRACVAQDIELKIASLGGGTPAPIEPVTVLTGLLLLQLGEFYVVTAKLGEDYLERIIKIHTEGIPPERDNAVYKHLIKDRNTFLRYIALILADDYLLTSLEQFEFKDIGAKSLNPQSYTMPVVYENMLRAAAQSPERLLEIDMLIKRLDSDEIVPPEFQALFSTFLRASRRIK